MGLGYRPASEAERIGKELIGEHFPDIVEADVRVEFVFRSEATKVHGRVRLGECKKIGGFTAWLSQDGPPAEEHTEPKDVAFYAVVLAEDMWEMLTEHQRRALVHHELCHILVEEDDDGGWVLKTKGHDVEEFASTVKLFGVWAPDLEWFVLMLPFDEAPS